MNQRPILRQLPLRLAVAGLFALAQPAFGQNTDIANEPLSQAASGVRPNIMFILDDSGSMGWDYSPDYVDDDQPSGSTPSRTAACFDAGDTGYGTNNSDDAANLITGRADACIPGDPPYMSPDFNKQYYNPNIWYRPAVNADGTEMAAMTAAITSNWTAVPTDPFGEQQRNTLGQSQTNANLVTGYPDRRWCRTSSSSDTDCQVNSDYTYPNWEYLRGINGTGGHGTNYANVKYDLGDPYYYRMQSAQWCSSATLDVGSCVSGSAVNPAPGGHVYIAPEFCTDPELVNCAAGAALTPAHTFSGVRWCSDQNTLLNCQRKKVGNFRWPKHLGVTRTVSVPLPATAATGTVTITGVSSGEQVTALSVGGVAVIVPALTAGSTSNSAMATQIANAINALTSSPNYTASIDPGNLNRVIITAAVVGTAANGRAIAVAVTQTGTVSATGSITVNSTGNNNDHYVEQVRVNHPDTGWTNIMATNCTGSYGNGVSTVAGGTGRRILADTGTNATAERNAMAEAIRECINQASGSNGGFTATRSNNVVTVVAPVTLGNLINNLAIAITQAGQNVNYGFTNFAGGASATISTTTSGSMTGGTNATSANIPLRAGYGFFTRTDIESSNDSYPKASGRIDCGGTTCTYAQEMTNFANWYAYYRTRMQMMKSAAGRAFVPIDDTYRVGFITINPGSPVSASRYLRIQNFDPAHKANWYTKFYEQDPNGGTPLREALSRVGRLYAGRFDGINNGIPSADDPMEVSCQPNFAILSTDGYWTTVGTSGNRIDGTAMTQQDNVDQAPYSRRADGVFDGGSSSTVGLADTALYYYQTDLRPAGSTNAAGVDVSADNVPTTQQDFAAHQHMTTFTLGLGLDGTLSYRPDYQTATAGDFHAIKQGTLNWPNPVANAPAALDDLWHAAVNGRGVFFSASNPQELSSSLTDTLDALKRRVGAGAAAATSNLQPVAGDNFAFTAQYETQTWVGDLKARTIDLTTGAISAVELWSAQALLSGRPHTDRQIYTFDASDTYVSTSTGAVGNQLKHFCVAGATGAGPWCSDGPGLTAAEELLFDPTDPDKLPQAATYTPPQRALATAENLVNFLRGHQTYEDTGVIADTDLFRDRAALLGDIINAQPAYVKTSPFNYGDAGYQAFKACTAGTAQQQTPAVTCPAAQFPWFSTDATLPRRPTVYIAANDGMLHAFESDVNNNPYYQTGGIATATTADDTFSGGNNAGNGEERWAYIPGMVLGDLYRLASIPYAHRYLVDGSPTVGDVCLSTPCTGLNDWRTVLVGGLNAGGRGYYALDVTNPLAPRALWEFKVRRPSVTACAATLADAVGAADDCDLGLSFGNPVITKLKETGQWVAIVTSGLNNTGYEPNTTLRQGDGMGYLYVLDIRTGRILHKIATHVGDPGTAVSGYADANPSGLAKINNWVDNSLVDNTTLAVYGGDMRGNLWRFDLDPDSPGYALDSAVPANYLRAVKIAELKDTFGAAQPVTTKLELGLISSRRVVFVGTGRFLGITDKADTSKQSVYAIADVLTATPPVADRAVLVAQTLSNVGTTLRTVTSVNAVDWSNVAVRGWVVDLPDDGERVSVDPQLQLGTLVVGSNVPSTDTCVAGGTAWINSFDFRTGGFVAGATGNAVSQKISGSVAVGINVIQLPGGKVVTVVTTADNQQLPVETPISPTTFEGRRVGWRELSADQ